MATLPLPMPRLRTAVSLVLCALIASGCSTYVEDRASGEWDPVFPEPAEDAMIVGMASGSIFASGQSAFLAGDKRARQVGDILTVSFSERFSATKSQNAGSSKTAAFGMDLPGFLGSPADDANLSAGTTQSFAGSGAAAQSNSLTGRMSVSVVRILPGGNLEILGQKKLTLNNGDEYIRVRGIVRPEDISAQNVVLSERIANAEIKYIGAGDIADSAKQGWLNRTLRAVAPF
jgi:flagellar L-ring protein precursor FlgH